MGIVAEMELVEPMPNQSLASISVDVTIRDAEHEDETSLVRAQKVGCLCALRSGGCGLG